MRILFWVAAAIFGVVRLSVSVVAVLLSFVVSAFQWRAHPAAPDCRVARAPCPDGAQALGLSGPRSCRHPAGSGIKSRIGLRYVSRPPAGRCYSMISETTPEPTVRPPSLMAKRRP